MAPDVTLLAYNHRGVSAAGGVAASIRLRPPRVVWTFLVFGVTATPLGSDLDACSSGTRLCVSDLHRSGLGASQAKPPGGYGMRQPEQAPGRGWSTGSRMRFASRELGGWRPRSSARRFRLTLGPF